jgi:uncharacterized protein YggT (Ycf19 family)
MSQTGLFQYVSEKRRSLRHRILMIFAVCLLWALVAFVFAAQGYFVSAHQGARQAWWPSLGYSGAIFSIWALLTGPLVWLVRKIHARVRHLGIRMVLLVLLCPVTCAIHVFGFALLYWPLYSNEGSIPSRSVMGERMFVRNLDTNTLIYVLIVGTTVWRLADRRQPSRRPEPSPSFAPCEAPPLRARVRGQLRLIPLPQIDWIQASGDYVEVHAGTDSVLLDESLTSLDARLPPDFARIHRQHIIRLDRIREVRSAGRGDATVILASGAVLRLSRRYRANVAHYLPGAQQGDPVQRPG